jgi:beta-keto acid cleavage enzyme
MVADATPEFYIEHLKRLRENKIQPMFAMAYIHTLEAIEHLIRTGVYMGPLNHTMTAIGGAGACSRNPFDFMEWVRRSPQGSVATYESLWRTVAPYAAMTAALGIHMRVGIEDNLWRRKGERMTSVQQVEQVGRIAKEMGRKVATADEARRILKIGTWYNSPDETLANLGCRRNPVSTSSVPRSVEGGSVFRPQPGARAMPEFVEVAHVDQVSLGAPMLLEEAKESRSEASPKTGKRHPGLRQDPRNRPVE